MIVISLVNPKGGTGKTTCAINISTCLSLLGYKVVVLDLDPLMNFSEWSIRYSPSFDIISCDSEKTLTCEIYDAYHNYDYAVIDCSSGSLHMSAISMMQSDIIIIPLVDSPLDALLMSQLDDFIEIYKMGTPKMIYLLPIGFDTHSYNKLIECNRYKVLHRISHHYNYITSLSHRLSIFDTDILPLKNEILYLTNKIVRLEPGSLK
uniref:Plasmid partition protein A n=1 Tax=Edwardsiella tarda TaxID=636 RepID=A0A2S1PMM5_EDWTA|nr:plasmid partition protein A [Edwardsiella tarda]